VRRIDVRQTARPVAAVLALLCAVAYGAGDFLGGLAARRLPPPAVVLRSNFVGLLGLLVAAPFFTDAELVARDAAIGAAGGVSGGVGVLLLYRGLATGTMSVVAPITAVLSAVVPVLWGLGSGERPSVVALAGVPLALVAVALLAREPRDDDTRTHGLTRAGLLTALGAGLGFGIFFVSLDATSDDAGLWPVVAGRTASVATFALVAAVSVAARPPRGLVRLGSTPWLLVGCGLLDAGANALFLVATQQGLLTLVAVLAALYPASTLLLARAVLGERLARPQLGGVLLAGAAVVLVTAG
jgi:drug/metabolite transporter (DMT)-like permease